MRTDDFSRAQRSSLLLLGNPAEAKALAPTGTTAKRWASVVLAMETLRMR